MARLAERDRAQPHSVYHLVVEDEPARRIPEPARVRPRQYAVVVVGRR
ncbi:MAG TPA: hypothetical protein VFQ65_17370 [Kofleriaceae bacterium]|nr:hypothetical protein [Kofleriaceae bacterium]